MTVSVGSIIAAADYNSIHEEIKRILNSTQGGYGADLLSSTTATTNMVASAAHWNALFSDVNKCIKHQTGANISGISVPTSNDLITATFVNVLASSATIAVLNSGTVHPSQLATFVSATSFTNVGWDSEVQIIREYHWDSNLEAHYHFNLGGYLSATIGYSGTPGSSQDNGFVEFVGHANQPYSQLYAPYTRANWLGGPGTVTKTYSTNTTAGIFTSTVVYTRVSTGTTVLTSIVPPAGISPINLVPITSATLFYSTDAIAVEFPTIKTDRKILAVGSLAPFNFAAGTRSNPQILSLRNVGSEPIVVSSIEATSHGVLGYAISTGSNFSGQFPIIEPLTFPINIAANTDYDIVVYYVEPITEVSEIGTFYNNIIITSDADSSAINVPTIQNVSAPNFFFNLILAETEQTYTYDDWKTEFGLSTPNLNLGINIANTYYLPNTDFGIINGVRRYGLFRKPDAEGLKFWVDYTNANFSGDYTQIAAPFFNSIDASNTDNTRARISNKFFDPGFGVGDFYDKTYVDTNLTTGSPKSYGFIIQPYFGSLNRGPFGLGPGYSTTLSGQQFNGSPNPEAVNAFTVIDRSWWSIFATLFDSIYRRGPTVTFYPSRISNTGTYSTDITVTVEATDLNGAIVTQSKTENLTISVLELRDVNLVKWVSGFEQTNAVMGISYDRIDGKLHLTVGVGSGGDGAPTLENASYSGAYINVDNLGISGDDKWGILGNQYPLYRITDGRWGSFMNTYGVWPTNPTREVDATSYPLNTWIILNYKFTAQAVGTYSIEFSVDNYGYIAINNSRIIDVTYNLWSTSTTGNFAVTSIGEQTITLGVYNVAGRNNNPGGIAAVIRDTANNIVWTTLDPVRSSPPYLYWDEVYRIPIDTMSSRTYQLSNYLVKSSNNPVVPNYGRYFGTPGTASAGSIITIDSDGFGNLSFTWNPIGTEPLFGSGVLFGLFSNSFFGVGGKYRSTVYNILSLPYYYNYLSSRIVNIGPAGSQTDKLIGMTLSGVRTTRVITPGYGTIEVQSTVSAQNIRGETSYLKINGITIPYNYTRGHTLAVINPLTFAVESMFTYDTWEINFNPPIELFHSALREVDPGKIIALISYDATSLYPEAREILRTFYGSNMYSSWFRARNAHAFIGRREDPNFSARERLSDSDVNQRNYTYWPNGPTDIETLSGSPPDGDGGINSI